MTHLPRSFIKEENGSTVEFVIWLPLLMFILGLIVDTSVAFARHSHMWRISTEISRAISTGRLKESQVADRVLEMTRGKAIYEPSVTNGNRLVTTTLSLPLRNAVLLGALTSFGDFSLSASVTMELQPHVDTIF